MGFTRLARANLAPYAAYRRREALLREALHLSRGDPMFLVWTGNLLGEVGRRREALALAEEAKSLDPLLPSGGSVAFLRWLSLLEDYSERAAQFDAMVAKWPAMFDASVGSALDAGANADWPRYDALRRFADAQSFTELPSNQSVMRDGFRLYDAIRDHDQTYLDDHTKRVLSRVELTGTVLLDALWSAGAAGHAEAVFQAVERATFDSAFESSGSPVSQWWAGTLFARSRSAALMEDPRFLRLCAKLGLVHYWLETGRWPDCADQVPYDFRAEARKVAAEGLARHV